MQSTKAIDIDTVKLEDDIKSIYDENNKPEYAGKNFATRYMKISAKFPEFEERYPMIFQQILDGKSMEIIALYATYINDVNEGKLTQEEAELELGLYFKKRFFSHIPDSAMKQE